MQGGREKNAAWRSVRRLAFPDLARHGLAQLQVTLVGPGLEQGPRELSRGERYSARRTHRDASADASTHRDAAVVRRPVQHRPAGLLVHVADHRLLPEEHRRRLLITPPDGIIKVMTCRRVRDRECAGCAGCRRSTCLAVQSPRSPRPRSRSRRGPRCLRPSGWARPASPRSLPARRCGPGWPCRQREKLLRSELSVL